MRKLTIIFLSLLIILVPLMAQEKLTIKGTIKDKVTNETLIGANVKVIGTSLGTITDYDGNYQLNDIPKNSIVIFSYIGMSSQEREIKSSGVVNIFLDSNTKDLEEIVVVGYGTSRKRDLTGSIVSISGESLKTSPDHNPVKSLQGKVPGLVVTNSGAAGSSPDVKIRGIGTTYSGTQPLYIVDGMFTDNIDFVNPNDILSTEVLKDPSSLAIFGVQGANGVIIITTKRADKGKMTVSYDGYVGSQMLHNRDRVSLTNADQFTQLYNEQLKNMNPAATEWSGDLLGGGTDWQSYIFRPAMVTNHGVTVANSNEKANTVFSLGYFLQDGIVKYNSYQRFNARWAGDYQISKKIKVGSNITLTRWDADPSAASVSNAVQALPTYSPYAPLEDHNADNIGSLYTPSPGIQKDVANPVAVMEINKGNSESYGYRAVGNVYAEINFLKDFTFKAVGYGDIGVSLGSSFTPRFDVNNATSNSSHKSETTRFSRNSSEYTKYQADFLLNYNKKIDLHRIGALVGYTARIQESQGFSASTDSLISGDTWVVPTDFWMLSAGADQNRGNGDWYSAEAFTSYLSRLNYSYADKYIGVLTFRADASSKFAENYRWGFFPSVGLAWMASEEEFFAPLKEKIDYLKIKASWGQFGNDKIGNYMMYPQINPRGQQVVVNGVTYYLPTQANHPDTTLHWEVIKEFDAGFEAQLFKNRMKVEVDYYNKLTTDMLSYLETSAGINDIDVTNIGSIRNSGLEFILSWNDKIGKFNYGISLNGATLQNEVIAIGNDNADIVSGKYHRTSVGHSVGAIYGYVQEGIFQNQAEISSYYPAPWTSKPGDIRYKDLNGDEKITSADRDFIGRTIPTFTYGFSLNAAYKNFDTNIDFSGVYGNDIINAKKLPTYAQFNFYTTSLNRWHGEGTSTFEPSLNTAQGHNFESSTNLLESGAYMRLRSVQLGYNFSQSLIKKINLTKVRIYANAQNLLTFKQNSGFTPEIGGSILSGSIDSGGTYPIPTTYSLGLTVNF
ncbi:MAG TPA: TonB-dependent receptor [Paludibacter sp.]|nr:TonB-dependent receptor [Paludibacter sp.]